MKILIISDSHGNNENVKKALAREDSLDRVIHLGDIEHGYDQIRSMASCPVTMVRGNMDSPRSGLDSFEVIEAEDYRIFATHGHLYEVQWDLDNLVDMAQTLECDIALFGHIHKPYYADIKGMTVINPGSISRPRQRDGRRTYGILEINEEGKLSYSMRSLDS